MSSLFDALVNDMKDEIPAPSKTSGFTQKLASYRNKVVNDYMRFDTGLSEGIAKIASENALNDDQIQRVVEEVNNQVYLIKYAQMKNETERDVQFPVAMLKDIKAINEKNGGNIEKKASVEDALNAFNFTSYEFAGAAPDKKKDLVDIVAEKIASDHSALSSKLSAANNEFDSTITKIAECIIRYDRAGADTQKIFDTMCRDAYLRNPAQEVIKLAIEDRIGCMKEAKLVANEYSLSINDCDISEEYDDFSLGKFSFMKTASEREVGNFPTIVTEDGTVVRNIGSLVKIASEIIPQKNKIDAIKIEMEAIESKLRKEE